MRLQAVAKKEKQKNFPGGSGSGGGIFQLLLESCLDKIKEEMYIMIYRLFLQVNINAKKY